MTSGFLAEIVGALRRDPPGPSTVDAPATPQRPRPSLARAIRAANDHGALVVEYKRVSPGQPDPRLPVRSVGEFVRATEGPGVVGYSCLATRPRFEGSPDDVAELVRSTSRPVLYKDFVVGVPQLELAARTGASAVLLIARLEGTGLLDRPIAELAERARELGLEVVLEFHRRSELSVAGEVRASVYGVNVRDLDTLLLDRPTGLETLRAAAEQGLHPLLGLSGVEGPEQARGFWEAGADGILVGTAVAREREPARLLASLGRGGPRG
jgi:indole-3-glycerol phosphate synthase